jgi:hypothetical protein
MSGAWKPDNRKQMRRRRVNERILRHTRKFNGPTADEIRKIVADMWDQGIELPLIRDEERRTATGNPRYVELGGEA